MKRFISSSIEAYILNRQGTSYMHHELSRSHPWQRTDTMQGALDMWSHLLISHSVMSDSLWPWTIAYQAPLSMEFSRREYWSGWPFPAPGDLPNPGIEPRSPALQTDSLWSHLVLTIIPTRYQYYLILQMRKIRFREIELCKFTELVVVIIDLRTQSVSSGVC